MNSLAENDNDRPALAPPPKFRLVDGRWKRTRPAKLFVPYQVQFARLYCKRELSVIWERRMKGNRDGIAPRR